MSIIRGYDARIDDVIANERSIVARINTDEMDRYNTVIDPKGGKFENYRKNPVCLWEHGKDPRRGSDPMGKNQWLKPSGRDIIARTKFLDDDFSQQRYEWYRDGVLSGFSVNILPDAEMCGAPTKDEIRARPELERCNAMYRSWDLAEYSGTAVPGNASCLTEGRAAALLACVERGLWFDDDTLQVLRSVMPATTGLEAIVENVPELVAAMTHAGPYIDSDGTRWHVRNADASLIASFLDAKLADECLRLMDGGPGFAGQIGSLMGEMRAAQNTLKAELKEYIDLYRYGRV